MTTFDDRFQRDALPGLNKEFGLSIYLGRGPLQTDPFEVRRDPDQYITVGGGLGINATDIVATFQCPKTAIVLQKQQTKPQAGDLIYIGGTDEAWRVGPPDDATEPAVPHRDGYDWIVYAKQERAMVT